MGASVVGSWRVVVTIPGSPAAMVNLANINSDGTMVVAFAPVSLAADTGHAADFYSTALGSWEAASDGAVNMTFLSLGADARGTPVGMHTISARVTVSSDGASWTGPFRIDIDSATGDRVATVNGTVQASRIVVAALGQSAR